MNMNFFEYKHLPAHLQDVSEHFYNIAWEMQHTVPASEEKEMGFRKLLEAKDCFVRASL